MITKLIVGLGNPGIEYMKNRHNVGFLCIDYICEKLNIKLDTKSFNGIYSIVKYKEYNVIIAKPLTFMNLSGEFVRDICKFYKIDLKNVLVIFDDMDTEIGKIRIRKSGSSGGQNGIKNIINLLGTQEISRIRIGIGKPKNNCSVINWVLGNFNNSEKEEINKSIEQAGNAAIAFIEKPIDFIMNHFNK